MYQKGNRFHYGVNIKETQKVLGFQKLLVHQEERMVLQPPGAPIGTAFQTQIRGCSSLSSPDCFPPAAVTADGAVRAPGTAAHRHRLGPGAGRLLHLSGAYMPVSSAIGVGDHHGGPQGRGDHS